MKSLSNSIILVALALLLTACGGGGGSPPSSPQPTDLTSGDVRARAASLGEEQKEQKAAEQAALAEPNFGSVTQSSNRINRVSTDTVNTSFSADGQTDARLMTTITRQGGGSTVLDTESHSDGPIPVTDPGIATGRVFGRTNVLKISDDRRTATLGLMAVDWLASAPSDYLALGYWIHATGDLVEGQIDTVEIGAFTDGPEIDGTRQLTYTTGTARYQGRTAGLYTIRVQSSQGGTPDLGGQFFGEIDLLANFGPSTGTISGTVDNIELEDLDGFESNPDYEIHLGSASFDANGEFKVSDVEVSYDGMATSSEGSWGGRFSEIEDSAGDPRLVAGTLGGTTDRGDGAEVSFVGAFYGASDNFQ